MLKPLQNSRLFPPEQLSILYAKLSTVLTTQIISCHFFEEYDSILFSYSVCQSTFLSISALSLTIMERGLFVAPMYRFANSVNC